MTQTRLSWRTLGWPVYVGLALLIVFAAIFGIELLTYQTSAPSATLEPVSADSYRARVAALLANADPARGAAAVEKYGCIACHRAAPEAHLAPSWVGIAERAATRRPPMPADAYIYESITNPSAYVVEGYTDVMIKNFAATIPDQDLCDIIAYLLTPDAR
jgi:hypothetical protein